LNRRFTGRKHTHANGRSHRADQRHPYHLEEAEEDNALVFRFYEFECRDSEVRLVLSEAASRAADLRRTFWREKHAHWNCRAKTVKSGCR
jgi:hypothetical protein